MTTQREVLHVPALDGVGKLNFATEMIKAMNVMGLEEGDTLILTKGGTPVRARSGDPTTSQEAAELITPAAQTQERDLLRRYYAADLHGLTADEAAEALGYDCHRRCSDLTTEGWTKPNGKKRPGKSGRGQEVKVLTDEGHAKMEALTD